MTLKQHLQYNQLSFIMLFLWYLCMAMFGLLVVLGKMEPFIVGGKYTEIDSFPHAVYLEFRTQRKWICGSSVLNQDILLTAAHCLYVCAKKECQINAYAGHESLYKVTIIREIKSFAIHGNYDDITMEFDIGLAKVEQSLPLGGTNHIKRIMLMSMYPADGVANMAGWGIINDETKEASVTLKMTTQIIKTKNECTSYFEMNAGVFCASNPNEQSGRPSEGDSGSALVTKSYQQIGLVSFRVEDHPHMLYYTNVTYFYNWIRSAASYLYCTESDSKFYSIQNKL